MQETIKQLEFYATIAPIELFVLFGAFIEEIIAPIPSPFIMTLGGSIAERQNHTMAYLILLAALGAVGKTLGAWILYSVADKAEDVIINKYGAFFGVTHKEAENIGKRLNKGWQDNVFLFIARALPIVPSATVSVICGLIKLNIKTYLFSTFLGTCVRNMLFLYVGFVGIASYKAVIGGLDTIESMIQMGIGIGIVGIIIWAYYKRKKHPKIHTS